MSRYQDAVIDDDEETCPLCIEEFDLSDRNFRPCPCGYQICQFCFNSLKNTYEKSNCPNCRRPYDESTIQYKMPTAEELKLDQMNRNKKMAAAKRKETEKREVEASNRRNLAGVRVKQQNLVYVIGLEPTLKKDEAALTETLRGKDYFGQYGPIEKIVVSKPKPGAVNQSVGVYVTFRNKEDAATCINCVDGSQNGDRVLRAQYGTTKYCSTYLRGDTCQNKSCSFLHENGEDGQNTSLQNEPIDPKPRPTPARSQPTPQPHATSSAMARENSREGATSRQGSTDGSALPPTAGWANTNAPVARARRASHAASASTASPQLTHSLPSHRKTDSKNTDSFPPPPAPQTPQPEPQTVQIETATVQSLPQAQPQSEVNTSEPTSATDSAESASPTIPKQTDVQSPIAKIVQDFQEQIKNTLAEKMCSFIFDDSVLSEETRGVLSGLPPLIDPYGGAKRRLMQDKEDEKAIKIEAEEKNRLEEQAKSAAEDAMDEEPMASGSLALGGEPEDNPRSASARGTIGRPSQTTSVSNLPIDQLSNIGLGRSLTPQQRQQLALLNAGSAASSRLAQPPNQNTAFEMSDFDRRAPQYSQAQYDQISSHARHGSRYFNNESKSNNNRFSSQQQPYFSSGVQGPPPGLPAAGTPPVSGGGMFAHGQGFTSSGFGAGKEGNDALRARSGTNADHQIKRELLLSLNSGPISGNPLRSPPASATTPGVLNSINGMYNQYPGSYQDPNFVKQKRKGKKQRHANTSSSGGGVDHLASDPSILSARVHQAGTGQGVFGGSQEDRDDFPPLPKRTESQSAIHSRVASIQSGHGSRTGTPKIPPGFERTVTPKIPPGFEHRFALTRSTGDLEDIHAHTTRSDVNDTQSPKKDSQSGGIAPVLPAIPNLSRSRKSSLRQEPRVVEGNAEKTTDIAPKHESTTQRDSVATTGKAATRNEAEEPVSKNDDAVECPSNDVTEPVSAHLSDGKGGDSSTETSRSTTMNKEKDSDGPQDIKVANLSAQQDLVTEEKDIMPKQQVEQFLEEETIRTPDVLSRAPTPPTKSKGETKRPALKTLSITSEMIARSESQAPQSTPIEKSAVFPTLSQIRQSSRQPSISTSRPSTPAHSERMTSQNVSRAGSPPPGVVGGAPTRGKSKAQAKKDRKKKAGEMSETGSVAAAPTPPAQEEVGPIVARQKKQKKNKSTGNANIHVKAKEKQSEATEENLIPQEELQAPASPIVQPLQHSEHRDTTSAAVTPVIGSPNPPPAQQPRESYTLRDFYNDAAQLESQYFTTDPPDPDTQKAFRRELLDLVSSQTSPLQQLLSEMIVAGDITRDHPLLAAPSFNSPAFKLPPDNRKGQAYLDENGYTSSDSFGMVYLPHKEKKALYNGHAVSVADSGERTDDLLRSCLITPSGYILRHLSKEESEKVLDLEERRSLYIEEYGDLGRMDGLGRLEHDDYCNLEGGFEELSRFGENHGVCWIVGNDNNTRRRFARGSLGGNGLDDDYGLGDMPLDPNADFDPDQFDDPDDEDDEEELDGEQMVLGADVEFEHDQYHVSDVDDDDITFANVSEQAGTVTTLPPLPEMMNKMSMPGAWASDFGQTYATRGPQQGMYTSLNTPSAMAYPPLDSADLDLPPPPPLPSNTQMPQRGGPLPPMRHPHTQVQGQDSLVRLRAMDTEQLEKVVRERAREIEGSRKEAEKLEKLVNKRAKEANKWRENLLKSITA